MQVTPATVSLATTKVAAPTIQQTHEEEEEEEEELESRETELNV